MPDLINQAGIRKRIRAKGCNTASKSMDRFDELVANIAEEACERAKKNGRKTVMPQDI